MAAFDPRLEALVAAPEHHRLLFENDAVRVLETRVGPGETTALHAHAWPGVLYMLSSSDFVRRGAEGETLLDSREAGGLRSAGEAVWSTALDFPHTLENVGESAIHVIAVEVKPPPVE